MMKNFQKFLFLVISMISIILNANPPIPEKMYEVIESPPTLVTPSSSNLFKRLDSSYSLEIQNSTLVTNIYDDYKTEEHKLILIAKNLHDRHYFTSWSFTLKRKYDFDDIKVACRILDSSQSCTANKEITNDGEYNSYTFSFQFKLYNNERLIIEHSHKIKKSQKEILYKIESIRIPILSNSKFCDYKYTIPDGYKFLGFQENLLTKESDKIFTYKGECPTESKTDVIRFTPEQSMWKANISSYLVSSKEFKNNIQIRFPRYYRGGKNINSYYRIFSTEGHEFNEEEIVDDYTKLKVEIPAANTKKLGVELYTAFTNKLSNEFNVYFPESFYEIKEDSIDADIKTKAKEIINNSTYYPGKPSYYKLGKFVNNYMTYDLEYIGKDYTPKEIYNLKRGVCEHYTILYNEMLNAIGIKTLYLTGWAFQNDETSGNKDTIGHAWTAALINDKWMELDATWGLFEGIPAGHVLQGFFKSTTSYFWSERINPTIEEIPNIELIIDNSELKDLSNADDDYSDSEKDESTNKEDTNEIKDDIQSSSVKENAENHDEDDNSSDNNEKKEDEQEEIEKIRVPNEAKGIKFSLFLIILIFFS